MRCNAICPGLIETGMTEFIYTKAREKGFEDKIGQLNPMQRGGIPTEIAEAVVECLKPVQERYAAVREDREGLRRVLRAGAEAASARADATLRQVHDVLGFIPE